MENTLEKIIEILKDNKRPELINATIYGRYSSKQQSFLYNDSEREYELHTSTPDDKEVRSVKAFVSIIKEELARRENETGFKSTVKVNLNGGYFIPDDDFGEEKIIYSRLNSQQWNLLENGINRTYNHRDFLKFLQALAPSFDNFQEIFRKFSLLRVVGKSTLTSNPYITQQGQEQGYTCTYKLEDGCTGEEQFPSGFSLTVPFAKAGDIFYTIPVELLFFRDEDDNLNIEVQCPLFENIEEKAVIDEAEFVKRETAVYTKLLVLSDF